MVTTSEAFINIESCKPSTTACIYSCQQYRAERVNVGANPLYASPRALNVNRFHSDVTLSCIIVRTSFPYHNFHHLSLSQLTASSLIATLQIDHHSKYIAGMPPKRRSTGRNATTTRQQSTLSFHGKANKVTKPGQSLLGKSGKTKKDPIALEDEISTTDVKDEAQPDLEEPTTAEKVIQQQTATEADALHDRSTKVEDVLGGRAEPSTVGATGGKGSGWVGDEEEKARKVSDAQIKRYWQDKESQRLVPRVHQEDLGLHEKILREWDMSGQYGVSCSDCRGW